MWECLTLGATWKSQGQSEKCRAKCRACIHSNVSTDNNAHISMELAKAVKHVEAMHVDNGRVNGQLAPESHVKALKRHIGQ